MLLPEPQSRNVFVMMQHRPDCWTDELRYCKSHERCVGLRPGLVSVDIASHCNIDVVINRYDEIIMMIHGIVSRPSLISAATVLA